MAKKATPENPRKKVLVKVWKPLLEALRAYTDDACLRQDAFLSTVLKHEAEVLSRAGFSNSDEARRFLLKELRALDTEAAAFSVPQDVLEEIDAVCAQVNVHRDCFINRVLLLLVPNNQRQIYDWLYDETDVHVRMFQAFHEHYDSGDYDSLMFSVLQATRGKLQGDPLGLIREALMEFYEDEEDLGKDPLYRLIPPGKTLSLGGEKYPMIGFNLQARDVWVPGTDEAAAVEDIQLLL